VGVSRAQSIERGSEPPHYNGLTLLGNQLRAEHFTGGTRRFRELDLIRLEYDRLRALPIGKLHTDDDTLL
jgi:hypothetical protein